MSAGIALSDRLQQQFLNILHKRDAKTKYVIYSIEGFQIIASKVSESESWDEFVDEMPADECQPKDECQTPQNQQGFVFVIKR